MKLFFRNSLVKPGSVIAIAVASLLSAGAAQAVETASGTPIENQATLKYKIGTTDQPDLLSNKVIFTVDNKINLSVVAVDTVPVSVAPGSLKQVTTFTVTNLGNTAQGYTLVGVNYAGAVINSVADSIDVDPATLKVYVESGANLGYQPGEDTLTAISSLPPFTLNSIKVYIVADIPVGAANGAQANVSLTATTTTTGTATPVIQSGADTAGVDIVFADTLTTELEFVGASAARDAKGTARNAYRVASALVTVTKTVAPVCDPFNGTNLPKNIPGSFVRYTITVLNAGPTAVNLASISDLLPATVTFDNNLITGAGSCTSGTTAGTTGTTTVGMGTGFQVSRVGAARTGFPKSFTSTSSVDGVDLTGGNTVNVDFALVLPVEGTYLSTGQLLSGESVSLIFNVQVN